MLVHKIYATDIDTMSVLEDLFVTSPILPCVSHTYEKADLPITPTSSDSAYMVSVLATPESHIKMLSYFCTYWGCQASEKTIVGHFNTPYIVVTVWKCLLPSDIDRLKKTAPYARYYIIVPTEDFAWLEQAVQAAGFPISVPNMYPNYTAPNSSSLGINCSAREAQELTAYLQNQGVAATWDTKLKSPKGNQIA
ncbi:MAG: hypothetical protein WAX89_01895 [Alphaproteobacteria bacterium]